MSENQGTSGQTTDSVCPVCHDQLGDAPTVHTDCKHTFHCKCAYTWWRQNSCCPMCKRDVSLQTFFNADTVQDYYSWSELKLAIEETIEQGDNLILKCKKSSTATFYVFYVYERVGTELSRLNRPFKFDVTGHDENLMQEIEDTCKTMKIAISTVNFGNQVADPAIGHAQLDDSSSSFINLSTKDLESMNNTDHIISASVRKLFERTIEIEYNSFGGSIQKLRFITMDGEFIFTNIKGEGKVRKEGGEKRQNSLNFQAIKNHALSVKKDINFTSNTTGNPYKGGKDGGSAW